MDAWARDPSPWLWASWSVVLVVFPIGRLVVVAWTEGRGILRELAAEPGLGRAVTTRSCWQRPSLWPRSRWASRPPWVWPGPMCPVAAAWRLALLLPIIVPDYVLGFSWTEAMGSAASPMSWLTGRGRASTLPSGCGPP